MPLTQMLHDPKLTPEQETLRSAFFERTGYGPSDLLSLNYETRTFMTSNGGLYRVQDGKVEWISGPSPDVEERDQWEM